MSYVTPFSSLQIAASNAGQSGWNKPVKPTASVPTSLCSIGKPLDFSLAFLAHPRRLEPSFDPSALCRSNAPQLVSVVDLWHEAARPIDVFLGDRVEGGEGFVGRVLWGADYLWGNLRNFVGNSIKIEGASALGHRGNYIRNYSIGFDQNLANALLKTRTPNAYISTTSRSPDF